MLLKLSVKNLCKSIKTYAVYFFTLIIGVTIFYIFNAIEAQSAMMDISDYQREIVELLNNMLAGVSVFVAVILGFLIIYASRFLMKRRKKEFGLYLLLGIGKRKVSLILFFETVLIGLISLIVGLIVGAVLSQLTSIFVAHMFAANMSEYRFVFSWDACLKTVGYFIIIYIIVIIFNTINVNRCKLIDLFYSNRKSEEIKVKNSLLCICIFAIGAVLLGVAYYTVSFGVEKIQKMEHILIYIAMGTVGTFFVFWSLSGLLLRIVKSIKKVYYKGLNSFTFRQISSRINTMVASMSIICIMLFVTICVLASSLTVRNSLMGNLDELAPADISLKKPINISQEYAESMGYNDKQRESSAMTIEELYKLINCDIMKNFKDYVKVNIYKSDDLTLRTFLGSTLDSVLENYPYLMYDSRELIMKLSDYNKVAEFYGNETYELNSDEYMIIADFDSMVQFRNTILEKGEELPVFNHNLRPKFKECKDGFVEMAANHITDGIIIVPDEVIDENAASYELIVANYNTASNEKIRKIESNLDKTSKFNDEYLLPSVNTKVTIAETSSGLGALISFIGLYLGIIFLISGAAILALKELSENADNIERYRVLKELGADGKLVNRALFKQIGIFFACPLILSIIHSVFGMLFSRKIIEIMGTEKMFISIVATACIMLFIYGGYFIITYFSCKNMINSQ